MTLRELLAGHLSAEIVCPCSGNVVRRLVVNLDSAIVDLDTIEVVVGVKLDAELWISASFSPFGDRGDVLMPWPEGAARHPMSGPNEPAKFCTEDDILRFEDGTETRVGAW